MGPARVLLAAFAFVLASGVRAEGQEDLRLCVSGLDGDESSRDAMVGFANRFRGERPLVLGAETPAQALEQGCDLLARLSYGSSLCTAELVAASSRKVVGRAEGRSLRGSSPALKRLFTDLFPTIDPGTELYQRVVAEREEAARSRAEAQPAAGGVSQAQLKEIVKAVVEGAGSGERKAEAPRSFSSDADKPRYQARPDPRKFAVVVGIEKYIDLPEARFAERDAAAVREHLKALGYPERNIMSLSGERASKAQLQKAFETWLPQNAGEGSEVFVYYSGHGAPDPASGQAYLLPRDGDPLYLKDTAYPLKRLYEKLAALKAARVLVALDSCFSGAGGRSVLPKGTRPLVTKVDLGLSGSGKVSSLTASAAQQISGTSEEQGHGLFTYYLLRGLNGAAKGDDGTVTPRSLHDYLAPNVQDEARRQNREQAPQLSGAGDWRLR